MCVTAETFGGQIIRQIIVGDQGIHFHFRL